MREEVDNLRALWHAVPDQVCNPTVDAILTAQWLNQRDRFDRVSCVLEVCKRSR